MKIFNSIFFIFMIISAGLQYNDPDPFWWISIYLYGAALCYLAVRNRYYPKAYLFGIAVYSIYAVYLFMDETGVWNWATEHERESIVQSMQATKPWIEETREFFGLAILMAVLAVNWIYGATRKRSTIKQPIAAN